MPFQAAALALALLLAGCAGGISPTQGQSLQTLDQASGPGSGSNR